MNSQKTDNFEELYIESNGYNHRMSRIEIENRANKKKKVKSIIVSCIAIIIMIVLIIFAIVNSSLIKEYKKEVQNIKKQEFIQGRE